MCNTGRCAREVAHRDEDDAINRMVAQEGIFSTCMFHSSIHERLLFSSGRFTPPTPASPSPPTSSHMCLPLLILQQRILCMPSVGVVRSAAPSQMPKVGAKMAPLPGDSLILRPGRVKLREWGGGRGYQDHSCADTAVRGLGGQQPPLGRHRVSCPKR